jgi:hypothetical protein
MYEHPKQRQEINLIYVMWTQKPKPVFWMLLSDRLLRRLPRFTKVLPIVTLILSPVIHPTLKEQLFRAYIIEPLPYSKNDMTDTDNLRFDFQLSGYSQWFISSFLDNSMGAVT